MRNAYSILVIPTVGTGTYHECPKHARADVNKNTSSASRSLMIRNVFIRLRIGCYRRTVVTFAIIILGSYKMNKVLG